MGTYCSPLNFADEKGGRGGSRWVLVARAASGAKMSRLALEVREVHEDLWEERAVIAEINCKRHAKSPNRFFAGQSWRKNIGAKTFTVGISDEESLGERLGFDEDAVTGTQICDFAEKRCDTILVVRRKKKLPMRHLKQSTASASPRPPAPLATFIMLPAEDEEEPRRRNHTRNNTLDFLFVDPCAERSTREPPAPRRNGRKRPTRCSAEALVSAQKSRQLITGAIQVFWDMRFRQPMTDIASRRAAPTALSQALVLRGEGLARVKIMRASEVRDALRGALRHFWGIERE